MTDPTDKLREALDDFHRVAVLFAGAWPSGTRAKLLATRAAVEALFAALYKSQQAALSANARAAIALEIAGSMLDDPTYERAPPDGDYEHPIHDKIAALVRERDEAREYAGEVRLREKAAEDARVSAVDALAQARRAEWQPIETAPKDGTYVLLAIDKKPLPEIASWFHGSGWEADNVFYRDDRCLAWMPLPQPPAQEGFDKFRESGERIAQAMPEGRFEEGDK